MQKFDKLHGNCANSFSTNIKSFNSFEINPYMEIANKLLTK